MPGENTYPCYEIVEGNEIQQGDLINDCPLIIPPKEALSPGDKVKTKAVMFNVVVISQSCDLENRNGERDIEIVQVCPFYTLTELGERESKCKEKSWKNQLRKGRIADFHLLHENTHEGFENDFYVVAIREVYGLHIIPLQAHVERLGKRLRICPPYREHLSQAFARFYMRVGLPVNIPKFT